MTNELTFQSVYNFSPGVIERLLFACFEGMVTNDAQREDCHRQWRRADRDTFENPDTIGACTFITTLAGQPIGMGCYDPRRRPEWSVIGYNCILPAFRGRGWGQRQLAEILRRLAEWGIQKAVVTTGDSPFFAPALRMYLAAGFVEMRRYRQDDSQFDFKDIELVMEYRKRSGA